MSSSIYLVSELLMGSNILAGFRQCVHLSIRAFDGQMLVGQQPGIDQHSVNNFGDTMLISLLVESRTIRKHILNDDDVVSVIVILIQYKLT